MLVSPVLIAVRSSEIELLDVDFVYSLIVRVVSFVRLILSRFSMKRSAFSLLSFVPEKMSRVILVVPVSCYSSLPKWTTTEWYLCFTNSLASACSSSHSSLSSASRAAMRYSKYSGIESSTTNSSFESKYNFYLRQC